VAMRVQNKKTQNIKKKHLLAFAFRRDQKNKKKHKKKTLGTK
jgi:hypothetical protein